MSFFVRPGRDRSKPGPWGTGRRKKAGGNGRTKTSATRECNTLSGQTPETGKAHRNRLKARPRARDQRTREAGNSRPGRERRKKLSMKQGKPERKTPRQPTGTLATGLLAILVSVVVTAALACGAPEPTATFVPEPEAVILPTEILVPTPTSQPTMLPRTVIESSARTYGSCQGQYTGEEMNQRARWMLDNLLNGYISPAKVLEITLEECGTRMREGTSQIIEAMPSNPGRSRPTPSTEDLHRSAGITPTPPPPIGFQGEGTATEPEGRQFINELTKHREIYERIIQKEWVQDGVDRTEALIILQLANLSTLNPEAGERVSKMPFLETAEPSDESALMSLAYLAWHSPQKVDAHLDTLDPVGGITDSRTTEVALLYGAYLDESDRGDEILLKRTMSIKRMSHMSNNGQTQITVAGLNSEPNESRLEEVEIMLIELDSYLGQPMHTTNVIVLYADTVPAGTQGINFQTHVAMEESHQRGGQKARHNTAHELTHYWWNSNDSWIDEGISQILPTMVLSASRSRDNSPVSEPCAMTSKIETLKRLREEGVTQEPGCEQYLGEMFFRTIRQGAGSRNFQRGIQELLRSGMENYEGLGGGREPLTIADVDKAFYNLDGEALDAAIANWYKE